MRLLASIVAALVIAHATFARDRVVLQFPDKASPTTISGTSPTTPPNESRFT